MTKHQPVLVPEVLRVLTPNRGESYFDATAGYGGHASAILERIGDGGRVVLNDRDNEATKHLEQLFGDRAQIMRTSFEEATDRLVEDGERFDVILLDLGISSPQVDTPERGFSFRLNGPLDMRMDRQQSLTAEQVINEYSETKLADIIYQYGEERFARRVARAIVAARPIKSTGQLAEIVRKAVPKSGDIDPATRTFQAIRIEVNDELGQLEQTLPQLVKLLAIGGRLAVISFHSLEDRIVKQFLDHESRDCICPPKQPICTCDHLATLAKLTRSAIKGTEDSNNPRARSAKLRAAVRIKTKTKGGA
ncbi:MAG TPA: 16S rRNA (cytosine(1402)-N(4))-methyltransferase RsmH [Candidatus Nanoarchaeia archaeon]|nr:16S rRNA (cytosine(1402)-N(4))-methyltransferase RsmH [Candidatus Nanoarchaeia archaeon]